MNLVIFGLTVSSSRGNGHATAWRALSSAGFEAAISAAKTERPRAVSEYMIERMLIAGVDKIAICCVCSTQAERSKP